MEVVLPSVGAAVVGGWFWREQAPALRLRYSLLPKIPPGEGIVLVLPFV